jgi:phospholipase C
MTRFYLSAFVCTTLIAATSCVSDQTDDDATPDNYPSDAKEDGATGPLAAARMQCRFTAGAMPKDTIDQAPANMPIKHVVVLTKENRSFDQMLGALRAAGRTQVDGFADTFSNLTTAGKAIKFHHGDNTCDKQDPPHDVASMQASYNGGKMDGFVRTAQKVAGSDGSIAMTFFDEGDLPFYYFLAETFSISDRYFSGMMGPTWPNRDFLYAATSGDIVDGSHALKSPAIFASLDKKGVTWAVYSDFQAPLPSIGFPSSGNPHLHPIKDFYKDAANGTLPAVTFFDTLEEHPPFNIQTGEATSKKVYDAVTKGPLWSSTALFITYDEAGGFADHVAPPKACAPDAAHPNLDHYGI